MARKRKTEDEAADDSSARLSEGVEDSKGFDPKENSSPDGPLMAAAPRGSPRAWHRGSTYREGQLVRHSGALWRSKIDNNADREPTADPTTAPTIALSPREIAVVKAALAEVHEEEAKDIESTGPWELVQGLPTAGEGWTSPESMARSNMAAEDNAGKSFDDLKADAEKTLKGEGSTEHDERRLAERRQDEHKNEEPPAAQPSPEP